MANGKIKTNNLPFLLEKKEVVLVKPAKPTPSEVLSFSTLDNDPNLEIICQSIYVYRAKSFSSIKSGHHDLVSSNGKTHDLELSSDPVTVISDALSRVLVYYYPLAGKLKRDSDGELRLNCNSSGVPFLSASANCELSSLDYLDGVAVEVAEPFVFDWPADDDGRHPLILQVTKFSCGGFTVGMGLSHSVCDGPGAAQFYRAMAELATGKTEPSVKPVWERERLVGKPTKTPFQNHIDKSSLATSPHLPFTEIEHGCFNVNRETIKRLKTSLMKECGDEFTTIEALSAYVWRSRFRALQFNSDGKTVFSLTVGSRGRLNPPLPDGYYGNAFAGAFVTMMGKDLNEGPLSRVCKLIKESKKIACSSDYHWNSINMFETMRRENIKLEMYDATLVLTDWRQLGLVEEVDFGWKGPVNMIPVPWRMFGYVGLCIFISPSTLDPKGGLRVLLSFPATAMAKFKEEMDALLNLGDDKALA